MRVGSRVEVVLTEERREKVEMKKCWKKEEIHKKRDMMYLQKEKKGKETCNRR